MQNTNKTTKKANKIQTKEYAGFMYVGPWDDEKKCPADTVGSGEVEAVIIKKANGKKRLLYRGEFKNGLAEGKGVYYDENESVYTGGFKNGKFEGEGIYQFADGDVYQGKCKNGFADKGIYTFATGGVYEGEYKNSKREGKGIMKYKNGDIYEGEFKNDKREGKGKLTLTTGEVYEGKWKNHFIEGEVTCTNNKGKSQKGEFVNNKFLPYKEVKDYPCGGRFYTGTMINKQPHGKGIWQPKKSDIGGVYYGCVDEIIEGRFEYGTMVSGTLKLHNNEKKDIMQWKLKNGKWSDVAKVIYGNGNLYKGGLKNGLPEGNEILKFKNGEVYEGEFQKGYYDSRKVNNQNKILSIPLSIPR